MEGSNFISRFFRGLWGLVKGYLIIVGLIVTLLPLIVVSSLKHLGGPPPTTPQSKPAGSRPLLDLTLQGRLVSTRERSPSLAWVSSLVGGENVYDLRRLKTTLKRAAKDQAVRGLFVHLEGLDGSLSSYAALRRSFLDFEKTGKPITVYLTDADDKTYFLASAATSIVLAPTAAMMLPGPTFNLVYFASALKKLGVAFDVERAGKYKSAFEPFVRDEPSEPTLEEYQSLESSSRDYLVSAIAEARKKNPSVVRGWLATSIFSAKSALSHGLVDGIGYPDQVRLDMERSVAASGRLSLERYDHEEELPAITGGQAGIGLIDASGEIHGDGTGSDVGITPSNLADEIRWAKDNDNVKAVVLHIDSPGGSAVAADLLWRQLRDLANAKPLIVSMGDVAASGGYFMAVAGQHIVAEPLTLTGSIGVISMTPNLSDFGPKWGVHFYVVTESARAGLLNPGGAPTADDKALLASSIDEVYQAFLSRVATGRKLSIARVAELAQGRVYTGAEAQKLGLVDELGGLETAVHAAKVAARLDPNRAYPLLRYEEGSESLLSCLRNPSELSRCWRGVASQTRLGALNSLDTKNFEATLRSWQQNYSRGQALMLWPAYLGVRETF